MFVIFQGKQIGDQLGDIYHYEVDSETGRVEGFAIGADQKLESIWNLDLTAVGEKIIGEDWELT
jgi:hypothetical protein